MNKSQRKCTSPWLCAAYVLSGQKTTQVVVNAQVFMSSDDNAPFNFSTAPVHLEILENLCIFWFLLS